MKTYKLILLFTIALSLYTGCRQTVKYVYQQPHVYALKQNLNSPVAEEGTVVFPNLRFKIELPLHSYTVFNYLPATNQAYAFQPSKPYIYSTEDITDIKVIALNDYNSQYPAGSDVSNICVFGSANRSDTSDRTKAAFLEYYNDDYNRQSSYSLPNLDFGFSITQQPDTTYTKQRFAVTLHTDKQAELTDTTQTIIILL